MTRATTPEMAAFLKEAALARCQMIFVSNDDANVFYGQEFLEQLVRDHRDYSGYLQSDEFSHFAVTTFMGMRCFAMKFYNGESIEIDHIQCIEAMFSSECV